MNIIKSTYYKQDELLSNLIMLHCKERSIQCDVTYSKGVFYKNLKQPIYKFDINPQTKDTIKASSVQLPLPDNSIESLMFDPPFVMGSGPSMNKIKEGQNMIAHRFGMFKNYKELFSYYKDSIKEFSRVIKDNGTLIIKCQDCVCSGLNHFSHCYIMNIGIEYGFYPKDLFILNAKSRIISGKVKNQKHARKFHSYFWVFKKEKCKINYNI